MSTFVCLHVDDVTRPRPIWMFNRNLRSINIDAYFKIEYSLRA